MDQTEILMWALSLGGGALVVLLGYWGLPLVVPWLKEKQVWDAVRPLATAAILEAYKASEAAVDAGLERLKGMEKAEIARWLYGYLPQYVTIRGIKFDVHRIISYDKWVFLVQRVFDELEELLDEARGDMREHFEGWFDTIE
jgi:hypothetical protein